MMNEKIENLFRNGQYKEAEEQLRQTIRNSPDDWQAKMLFGTCRLLQGDMKTAEQIHKEVEAHYSVTAPAAPDEKTFWQKYHNWIIYGTIAGSLLVLAGTAFLGRSQAARFKYGGAVYPPEEAIIKENINVKYGGNQWLRHEKMDNSW